MVAVFALFSAALCADTDLAGTNQEVLLSQYQDQTGQKVWSGKAKSAIRFLGHWRLAFKGEGEWVKPGLGREKDTGIVNLEPTHHHGSARTTLGSFSTFNAATPTSQVDAVSSASSRITTEPGGHGRFEGAVSLQRSLSGTHSGFLGSAFSYSGESDFQSAMLGLNGGLDFFAGNTVLVGNLGGGIDRADPKESPPGEGFRWPTRTSRMLAGIQIGQLLTSRARLGLSYAFSAILGPQENPYRRALVHTTLFPEKLPETRFRHVFGTEVGLYLGGGIAFFHREGIYFDTWGVQSIIPETALPMEMGSRWMLTPRHRWYSQTPARFYKTKYHYLDEGWLSGDPRLSRLQGNEYGLDLEFMLRPGEGASSLSLSGTYAELKDLGAGTRSRSLTLAILFRNPI